jgi:hypothetical protein
VGHFSGNVPLTQTGAPQKPFVDLSTVVVAAAGFWLLWSSFAAVTTLSWWHETTNRLRTTSISEKPDYDLSNLPWQTVRPQIFQTTAGGTRLVTSREPFEYQAYATIETRRASAVDFHFDATVESGGVSIGVLQNGRWIAASSSKQPGPFTGSNAARLGLRSTITLMIANNNPGGESRIVINSFRVFLRW